MNAVLVLAVLFPFLPRIVASTDTQPTFLLAFALTIGVSIAAPTVAGKLYRISLPGITALLLGGFVLYASLVAANAMQAEATIAGRLVSFLQFCAAALWGYAGKFRWNGRLLFGAVVVYALFTVIYFATHGALEDTLIQSRAEQAASLFASGRGARTLSPEPSFFALHIFNLFALAKVLRVDEEFGRVRAFIWFALVAGCLAASFSAYGTFLLLVVLIMSYPKTAAALGLLLLLSLGLLQSRLFAWESIRAVQVLLAVVQSRGSVVELMMLDASFYSRIASFLEYLASFARHPLVGDGFSLYQGGGFVSIVAAVGLIGALFFAAVLIAIVRGDFRITTKGLLVTWLVVHFISGPVGIPILGVIVGVLFRARDGPRRLASGEIAPAHGAVVLGGSRA